MFRVKKNNHENTKGRKHETINILFRVFAIKFLFFIFMK
jgi:hypothetical protein